MLTRESSRCLNHPMSLIRNLVRKFQNPDCHLKEDEKSGSSAASYGCGNISAPSQSAGPAGAWLFGVAEKMDRSSAAGEDLFNRLCEFMRIDAGRLELDFFSKHG